jgi:hypothetical protein
MRAIRVNSGTGNSSLVAIDLASRHDGPLVPLRDVFRRPAPLSLTTIFRLATLDHQPVQFPRHPDAGERGVGHQRQALAYTFIDDGEDAEAFGCRRATPL